MYCGNTSVLKATGKAGVDKAAIIGFIGGEGIVCVCVCVNLPRFFPAMKTCVLCIVYFFPLLNIYCLLPHRSSSTIPYIAIYTHI